MDRGAEVEIFVAGAKGGAVADGDQDRLMPALAGIDGTRDVPLDAADAAVDQRLQGAVDLGVAGGGQLVERTGVELVPAAEDLDRAAQRLRAADVHGEVIGLIGGGEAATGVGRRALGARCIGRWPAVAG